MLRQLGWIAASLAGACGACAAVPAIRVSPSGHYFVQAGGKPFFWLGDTAWSIFNHPTQADVDVYLDDRASKGFTVIQGCLVLWDALRHPNPQGQFPFFDGDPARINPAYFRNVDEIIDKAEARGLHFAILPIWTKGLSSNPRYAATFGNPEKMRSYCRFLGERYGSKNIFWVLGGDWPGRDVGGLMAAEAAGLREGAGGRKQLITYHPTGRESSSFWFQDAPWLDFNSIQSGHFIRTTNFRLIAADYAKVPVKPTVDMEPGYENITDRLVRNDPKAPRIEAPDVRRAAYLGALAGDAGFTYGCGEVYEFWSPGSGAPLPGWAAGLPWKQSLKLPGSFQVQYVRRLIESRPMLRREPDQGLLASDPDLPVLRRVEAMRGSDGSYAFVYSAAGEPFRVHLEMLSGKRLDAWWYDPRTGSARRLETGEPLAPSGVREFTPPSSGEGQDWVLVLDDAAAHYPPPGSGPYAGP